MSTVVAVSHATDATLGRERIAALARAARAQIQARVELAHVEVQDPRVGAPWQACRRGNRPSSCPSCSRPATTSAWTWPGPPASPAATGFTRGHHRLVLAAAGSTDAGAAIVTDPLLGQAGPVPEKLVELVLRRFTDTVEGCSTPGTTARELTASSC